MQTKKVLCLTSSRAEDELRIGLTANGWQLVAATNIESALRLLRDSTFHVGLMDFGTFTVQEPHGYAHELLRIQPTTQWVALLEPGSISDSRIRELVFCRFYDYHTLPVDPNRLLVTLGHAYGMSALHNGAVNTKDLGKTQELVGESRVMQATRRSLIKFARVHVPVLLTGESGTGKELAALAIHQHSQRREQPFVPINCGALPPTLIQSELFGHEKGAFTGAYQRTLGRIEAAKGGTVFLDEIGDLPLDLQTNLLRVLQEGYVERLGSRQLIEVNVRIIAATNVNLQRAVAEDRFRSDLYYRLNVLHLEMPPLRECEEDIEILAKYFFAKFANEMGARATGFTRQAVQVMKHHDWPGNVRELINRIQYGIAMSDSRLIEARDLDPCRATRRICTLNAARAEAEQEVISAALHRSCYNLSGAARELGISRGTLYHLMAKYNISHSGNS